MSINYKKVIVYLISGLFLVGILATSGTEGYSHNVCMLRDEENFKVLYFIVQKMSRYCTNGLDDANIQLDLLDQTVANALNKVRRENFVATYVAWLRFTRVLHDKFWKKWILDPCSKLTAAYNAISVELYDSRPTAGTWNCDEREVFLFGVGQMLCKTLTDPQTSARIFNEYMANTKLVPKTL